MNDYCSYEDLTVLENKCIPPIEGYGKVLMAYKQEIEQMKGLIERFDEVMLTKASKMSIIDVEKQLGK